MPGWTNADVEEQASRSKTLRQIGVDPEWLKDSHSQALIDRIVSNGRMLLISSRQMCMLDPLSTENGGTVIDVSAWIKLTTTTKHARGHRSRKGTELSKVRGRQWTS